MSETGPVVDLARSPHVKMHPVSLSAVKIEDEFWEPRIAINRNVTLPSQLRQCEETGRIDNFRRASGRKQGEFQGIFFNDSDVYKWAEAAAFSLAAYPDPKLEAGLDAVIDEISAAQQPDGYINTYFMFEREKERYTNLRDMHEIYCGGHLIQAAVAHFRATGKRTLLNIACRLADHWFERFGPGKQAGACGHEEAEMALVELYRMTGEANYLTLARQMIAVRGQDNGPFEKSAYHQSHVPFAEQTEMIGHAVRHIYLCCGAADVLAETGDAAYKNALETLWGNFTGAKMYVTGGAGARWEGEAFGANYELPGERAYAETCAAIGSVMWNWRMLNITGEAKYADLMERTLYNAVLPGLSLDGKEYFYQNPLADAGKHRRQAWFGCACCPPNIARMLASLPGYFYSTAGNDIYAHLYASHTAAIALPDGGSVTLTQQTDYPWNGEIEISIKGIIGTAGTLHLRIPDWCNGAQIDGAAAQKNENGYAAVPITAGSTIHLSLPMPVEALETMPYVFGNRGHIALQRGPIIYCIENADYEAQGADVRRMGLPEQNALNLTAEWMPDLLGGVMVLRGAATTAKKADLPGALYFQVRDRAPQESKIAFTAIPYYAWANREPGAMQVWVPSA